MEGLISVKSNVQLVQILFVSTVFKSCRYLKKARHNESKGRQKNLLDNLTCTKVFFWYFQSD